jgi:hypothetical protein
MNRLVFSVILLLAGIIFIFFDRGFFFSQIVAMPGNRTNNNDINNFTAPSIREDLGIEENSLQKDNPQNQIQSDLYNSISSGMSYEEVSSIIGWDGVLLYENEIKNGGKIIQIKVYQWNKEDVYSIDSTSNNSERVGSSNLYWNITLEFQDNLLINKAFSNLKS